MKKIIFSISIIITIFFGILGNVDASSKITAKLVSNQNTAQNGDEIKIIFGYDKYTEITEGINAYKAKLEYNEQIFEEVLESDFKTSSFLSVKKM